MFHIISLPRTASKSLTNALHAAICQRPHYLGIQEGSSISPLSEFLHNWGMTDYRFKRGLTRPFGHAEDVVYYKTHPKYHDKDNEGFIQYYSSAAQQFCWCATEFLSGTEDVLDPLSKLDRCSGTLPRPFVLKTQLALLLRRTSEPEVYLSFLTEFHRKVGSKVIHLTRSSSLAWVSSMILSDASGQFVPNSTQKKAISGFKARRAAWTREQVADMHVLWTEHNRLKDISDLQVTERDAVPSLIQGDYLLARERLNFSFAYTHEKEFSASQYGDMIENFDGLQKLVEELFV